MIQKFVKRKLFPVCGHEENPAILSADFLNLSSCESNQRDFGVTGFNFFELVQAVKHDIC